LPASLIALRHLFEIIIAKLKWTVPFHVSTVQSGSLLSVWRKWCRTAAGIQQMRRQSGDNSGGGRSSSSSSSSTTYGNKVS
jgi:hypothetical protein